MKKAMKKVALMLAAFVAVAGVSLGGMTQAVYASEVQAVETQSEMAMAPRGSSTTVVTLYVVTSPLVDAITGKTIGSCSVHHKVAITTVDGVVVNQYPFTETYYTYF